MKDITYAICTKLINNKQACENCIHKIFCRAGYYISIEKNDSDEPEEYRSER